MSDNKDFYDAVYEQDAKIDGAHGWIQWKGTDVCIDIHCVCGYSGHFDGDFFYYVKCPTCNRKFAVGQTVKLIELNAEQIQHVENTVGFKAIDS